MKKRMFLVLLYLISLVVHAQGFDCESIETLGNSASSYITDQINDQIGGLEYRISKRKKLVLNYAYDLNFEGCKMIVKLNVKLKRKIRRDASGNIKLKATVSYFDGNRVCLRDPTVLYVHLSHTAAIGEAVYKGVANRVLPNNKCFEL